MNRFWLSFSLFALTTGAQACINDRDSDSLAVQAKKLPDTLRVITGRFERNPPLYYQMRIRHSLAQLQRNPRDFGLYDDIGAAFDRLHRGDEALQIMAKKRAILPAFDAKNPSMKEAWYRYFANAGTFRAHRFLGDKTQPIGEMKTARDFIQRAIEIKPNAHFGREKYQLMAMNWILATKAKKTDDSLGEWIDKRDDWQIYEGGEGRTEVYTQGTHQVTDEGHKADSPAQVAQKQARRRQAVQGIGGLIVLGAAWQSVDVFEALANALASDETVTLRYAALLRCRELLKSGKKSLGGVTRDDVQMDLEEGAGDYVAVNGTNQPTFNRLYSKLRAEAETWNSQRQNYMMARLEQGQHPDWDKQFWADWKPAAPPSLDVDWVNERQKSDNTQWRTWTEGIIGVALLLGGPYTLVWLLDRFFSRRRKTV